MKRDIVIFMSLCIGREVMEVKIVGPNSLNRRDIKSTPNYRGKQEWECLFRTKQMLQVNEARGSKQQQL
jgi:hypothetical protein